MVGPVKRRVDRESGTLTMLKLSKALVRGMAKLRYWSEYEPQRA